MKFLKNVDFVAQTNTPQETLTLLSLLKECLIFGPKNADCPNEASMQTTACDRILRACIYQFGESLDCPDHLKSLQALADMAYQGYVSARLQYVPLYLERLLYHLLRGVAAQGPSDTCLRFADLLYADLLKHQPPQVPVDDYTSIAKSAFSVLWMTTDAIAKMEKMPAEFKLALSTQLQAVRFLLLLEHHSPNILLLEPPFLTSIVARHAAAAAVSFVARYSPLKKEEASFLNEQLFHLLVAAILEKNGVSEPLPFQDCLCIFELMVVRVRYLCKTGCFRQSKEVIQQSKSFLRKSSNESHCLRLTLDILLAGVELNKALLVAKSPVGPFFNQAAEVLNCSMDAQEPLLKVLAESGQLLVTPLYEHAKKDKQKIFHLHDILEVSTFMESYFRLLCKLLNMVPKDNVKQQQVLVKLLYHYFQLYTTVVYDSFQMLPGLDFCGLPQLLASFQRIATQMLEMLEGLPKAEQAEYLDLSAYCVSRLAYRFYSHKMYVESNSIMGQFCGWLVKKAKCTDLPTEKLHNCFKLQVENYRKLGLLEEGLQTVALWLASHHNKITEQVVEPVCSWVKVKMDANKNGADDLRLKTLKEGLEEYHLDDEILVKVLLEELKTYKTVRVDTGQERFNVICDLLDICSEGSQWVHERAFILVELAQVLCYHDYNEQTECSALDSINEALQLLEYVPKSPQNEEQLQDDKAQALLWLYICTVEDKMHESIKQEQRTRNTDTKVLQSFETNDLTYEDKSHDDKFLYLGIAFNLCADSVQSRCLDDALALWKQLLSKGRTPSVRSIEQTAASLHIMAALYRMMGKPLEAIESFFLITALSDALKDFVGKTSALCQIVKLLLQLECPSYAETLLREAELCLKNVDGNNSSYSLMNQTLAVLHSKLYLANCKIEEGLNLLVGILQNPALQRSSKVWYLLRASALQLTAAYLILPSSILPLTLRQKLSVQGWKTPETALSDAHRLYRSILLTFSLITSDASTKESLEHPFIDHGDNLVQKWQVLADMFVCSERFVSLLSKIETVSEAKAFCLETLKISMKVQSIRWCACFLVLKSELELQRNNLDLCASDLEQVSFLLESGTVFETKEGKEKVKIKPKKGGPKGKKPKSLQLESPEEEQSFLKEACLEFIDTVPVQKTLTTSPVLRPKLKKQPSFLNHSDKCCCLLCSDVFLSTICLRWLIISVDGELTFGNRVEGFHLLEAILQRCATVARRIAHVVAHVSQQEEKKVVGPCQSTIGLLDGLVAHTYVLLTKQSMNSRTPGKKLWQFLEKGLTFLSSKGPQLLELEYYRAQLLIARAVAAISVLTSRQDSYTENILSSTWSWKSPMPLTGDQEIKQGTTTEETFNTIYEMSRKSRTKKQPGLVSKSKPKRIQGTKSRPVVNPNDPFALGDSDSDTPFIVLKPPTESFCTPAQKSLPVSKKNLSLSARSITTHKAPFVVFEESSPKLTTELPKAPKVTRRMKCRIKIPFSDDSDAEGHPEAGPESQLCVENEPMAATRRTGRRLASNRKPAKIEKCSAGSSQECSKMVNPQLGRPSTRRRTRQEKQEEIQKASKEKIHQEDQGGGEKKEILKTNKESSEDNIEVLRGSDEKPVKETRGQPRTEDQEVLRRDFGTVLQGGFSATEKKVLEDPFNLHVLASSLDAPADILSMDSVYDSLQAAFHSIAHYPLGALYNHLCQLMALCIGNRDPIATAYLVSESVSITLRHQKMTMIHKKLNKMKKTSVAKQLEALTLQEGKADSQLQHLLELQNAFEFSCPNSTELETKKFREGLQEIPPGVTVCIMTLVSTQPETMGDILLLTRLEKGAIPVNIQIQTLHAKVSLSAALSEFEAILQKQKEISNFTEKEDWWTGRIALDKRMMALMDSLEIHVLSCWKIALLPTCENDSLMEEASHLLTHLRECGCEKVDIALLKVILAGSHLLTPQLVEHLVRGLHPAQPERALSLLQETVDKLKLYTGQAPRGHLVLVLDKHLQKLPWENIPCLRNQSITRLPSLHFLLSYSLMKKYQEETILNHGVSSSSTFYVLNPHKNLPGTEKMFKEWFQSEPGWAGVVGEVPSTDQVPLALEERDLYIYAGHGAGARFVDSILKMDCRAVALLFGCSSAALAVQGNLEGTGAILKFIMAGCPLVLGNLWDVTDRDIDRYMRALLNNWLKASSGAPLLQYVIESRQAPKLRYMIGAAPIAYGLPVFLK
ncbi:separin [Protobothrops mucrosquamatus]|uniref:separin n=1 Tax=Protobothrops mucrosquamatus TaxID=103944 RepID=UPI0010FB8217|nr:separin [Protobothrops mucrosquamatus]